MFPVACCFLVPLSIARTRRENKNRGRERKGNKNNITREEA